MRTRLLSASLATFGMLISSGAFASDLFTGALETKPNTPQRIVCSATNAGRLPQDVTVTVFDNGVPVPTTCSLAPNNTCRQERTIAGNAFAWCQVTAVSQRGIRALIQNIDNGNVSRAR